MIWLSTTTPTRRDARRNLPPTTTRPDFETMSQRAQRAHKELTQAYNGNSFVKQMLDLALYERTVRHKATAEGIGEHDIERRLAQAWNSYPQFEEAKHWLDASWQQLVKDSWATPTAFDALSK